MSKSFLCTCEDVTIDDLRHAVAQGYRDIESVKRYTGFGTGMCQGKSCQAKVAQTLAKETGQPLAALNPFTPRPPFQATPLRLWASNHVEPNAVPGPGIPPGLELPGAPIGEERPPLQKRAEVVIIGAGILGLATAYNLAKRGVKDVVVLDRSYLCAGASGRNGGGVRMQWGTRDNVELARRSIELCKRFARDMGINVWFRAGGYLFLARDAETARRLERGAELQQSLGVGTQILTPDGARSVVPELSTKKILNAAYNPQDGVLFPWPFLWGYASQAVKLGVKVETFTKVTGFEQSDGLVRAVQTERGTIKCDRVILAAGAWSRDLAELAGVKLPNEPHRHEILVTEPMKPFLGPLVSVLDSGLYFSQSGRGEIVGGMGDHREPVGLEMGSTLRFLSRFSSAILDVMPILGDVKVLRQWGGCYDVTPDNQPVLGPTPGLENLIQLNGFVGHGFMMGPAIGERIADWLCGEKDELFTRFNLSRFSEGRFEREDFIIG